MGKEFSPEEKATIVMEGLKKEVTIKGLCGKYGVSKTQYYRWKKRFIEGGKKELQDHRKNSNNLKIRNHYLQKLIYKLQLIISILKDKYNKEELHKIKNVLAKHGLTKREINRHLGK
jgi:transposase-like protein